MSSIQAAKQGLINLVQKLKGKPTSKEDVQWSSRKDGAKFIGTVTVPKFDLSADGEPCSDAKSAEAAAARVMIPMLEAKTGVSSSVVVGKKAKVPKKQNAGGWSGTDMDWEWNMLHNLMGGWSGGWSGGYSGMDGSADAWYAQDGSAQQSTGVSSDLGSLKQRLIQIVQQETGHTFTPKQDIIWKIENHGDNKMFICIVAIPHREMIVKGDPAEGKKAAETVATAAALQRLIENPLNDDKRQKQPAKTPINPVSTPAKQPAAEVCAAVAQASKPVGKVSGLTKESPKPVGLSMPQQPGHQPPGLKKRPLDDAPEPQAKKVGRQFASESDKASSAKVDTAAAEKFATEAGYRKDARVITIGEQDYAYSLSIAQHQQQSGNDAQVCATSFLGKHDPKEQDSKTGSRKSLSAMNGILAKNIDALEAVGGFVLHDVDATNLKGTFLSQVESSDFDYIVVPFPQASLSGAIQPLNSSFLRKFFKSINETGLLAENGRIQLLMLSRHFNDWDAASVAAEAGFEISGRTPLPNGFYHSIGISGEDWNPANRVLYSFKKGKKPVVKK